MLNEWKEYNENNEHVGTAKMTYEKNKVTIILAPIDNSWQDSTTLNLAASGWPKSLESIETEASRVQYIEHSEYTQNADDYTIEENSRFIEPTDDPLAPASDTEKKYLYFYEEGNLVKIEEYDKGSSTPVRVRLLEYDKSKPKLLKILTDEGLGSELPFKKPSRHLLSKVEYWESENQMLRISWTSAYTYKMDSHGLPTERLEIRKFNPDSQVEDIRFTDKFTYTKF